MIHLTTNRKERVFIHHINQETRTDLTEPPYGKPRGQAVDYRNYINRNQRKELK